jgi:predicted ester cyclase
LQDLAATGRKATWTGINIFRIECGRIVEVWSEVDALSRLQQLTSAAATP